MNWYSVRHLSHEDRLHKAASNPNRFQTTEYPCPSELHETFQSAGIIFSRAYLVHLFETGYDALHEVKSDCPSVLL